MNALHKPVCVIFLAVLSLCTTFAQNVHITELKKAEDVLKQRGEVFFSFMTNDRNLIDSLTRIISIDSYIVETGEILAYANTEEFNRFLDFRIDFKVHKAPSLVDFEVKMVAAEDLKSKGFTETWDSYPTYEAYVDLMYQFQSDFPELCKIHNIGTLPSGRSLLFAQISANVHQTEAEPRFMYTSTIHGDETTGYVLMLRLIHYLLNNYDSNPDIAHLLDNLEIWICPNENPDGTYYGGNHTVSGARRYNANGYDVNRNYPNPVSTSSNRQFETLAMMGLTDTLKFVMSANMHGGAEVVNYPWDSWTSASRKHADHYWWQLVSHEYADTARYYSPSTYMTGFDEGITHGGDWYVIYGGRQDYMVYYKSGREFTLEISDTKLLPASLLPDYWGYNYRSFLNYMRQALYGLRGIVTNGVTGEPIAARVDVLNYDKDNSHVFSQLPHGNYHRPLIEGIYNVKFSADGFTDFLVNGVAVQNYQTEVRNIELFPLISVPSPTNLVFEVSELKNISLVWDVPTHASPVILDHYAIYRNGNQVATTTDTAFTDSNLPSGIYTYTVTAIYSNPNWESDPSTSVEVNVTYFTISATAGENGSISPSGELDFGLGDNQTFSIIADDGYHIESVLVDSESVGTPSEYTFASIDANHTIHATFTVNTYSIVASPNHSDYGMVSGSGIYEQDETVTLSATPFENFHFVEWKENNVTISSSSVLTFLATADRNIIAHFAKDTHLISANVSGNGTISPSGDVMVEHGADISFTMTPDQGTFINSVIVDGVSVGSPSVYTFYNVTQNHSIVSEFVDQEPVYHQITVTSSPNGQVSPSGNINVIEGESISFSITPNENYFIGEVTLDDESVIENVEILPSGEGSFTLSNILNSHSLFFRFDINTYTITATAGEHGAINPEGAVEVDHGANQSFEIIPDLHYHIVDVLVDGVSVGPLSDFTFEYVTSEHTIEAIFGIDTYIIHATAGENGSISPNGDVVINHSSSQTFTITPDQSYLVEDVLVDGESVGSVTDFSFSDVSSDHTIEASFKIKTYTITATAGENGSISPSGVITVDHGSDLSFSISPNPGYHIINVLVDGVEVGVVSTYSFTGIDNNHTIHANFAINTYTITASAGENGSIYPAGTITLNHGESQTFSLLSDEGYHVDEVIVNDLSVGGVLEYTFSNVSANGSIHATFSVNTYTLTLVIEGNGNVSINESIYVEPLVFNYGSSVTLLAIPDNGWTFNRWTEDLDSQENPETLLVNANKQVKAIFSPLVNVSNDHIIDFEIYPNPFSESVILSNVSHIQQVMIINVLGKTVGLFEPQGSSEIILNTSDFAAGTYFVVFKDTRSRLQIRKVVKLP